MENKEQDQDLQNNGTQKHQDESKKKSYYTTKVPQEKISNEDIRRQLGWHLK